VTRAVAAAKRAGSWGATFVTGCAMERERFNSTRASNARKYGGSK
jgi:hypothetical protein